ncbi:hypothetical protein HanHA300_Chr15g0547981 [Helianthus annuus]|nr:hypothetical protein HanHA300_Chr15g0547981 [Helianthus annuus]KAJ0471361.1 hypothetical protein HanHA89_Chr15g0595421 [Helianthus annuus]KAJ0646976.1 hypothetical protein HanLR1_Chr15g0556951 [Helianthus annuus]KAJ0650875.1 hypothetical protein HanOQP8_Chr15g0555031 [Helianthus annuus]
MLLSFEFATSSTGICESQRATCTTGASSTIGGSRGNIDKPSFFAAENDFVRRSSGKNKFLGTVAAAVLFLLASELEALKNDFMAAAAVDELVELRREEEAAAALAD